MTTNTINLKKVENVTDIPHSAEEQLNIQEEK